MVLLRKPLGWKGWKQGMKGNNAFDGCRFHNAINPTGIIWSSDMAKEACEKSHRIKDVYSPSGTITPYSAKLVIRAGEPNLTWLGKMILMLFIKK